MESASTGISPAIIAGIILGAVVLIISVIILIWFIVSLSDIKNYLKSINTKATKANQNLGDIKLYFYQISESLKAENNPKSDITENHVEANEEK